MTSSRRLLAALALLAAGGLAGPLAAADAAKQNTEEAIPGRHVADPGAEHLKDATGCVEMQGDVAKTMSAHQKTTQTAPSPCPADAAKSQ
jgi:hypothetical protein